MPKIDMRNLPPWSSEMWTRGTVDYDEKRFEEWWAAHRSLLEHLGRTVAEQWVYRHFNTSPYFGLPLDRLKVRSERMVTNTLLTDVYVDGWEDQPAEYEWPNFYEPAHGFAVPREPGLLMLASGTPRTPILLLHTPEGFALPNGCEHDRPYCLIEGHTRWRCIRGLNARGKAASEHDTLLLSLE